MDDVNNKFDLKTELKALGMTQKDFADYININQNTISRWIRGDLLMPKWIELFIFHYKKSKTLDNMQKFYQS